MNKKIEQLLITHLIVIIFIYTGITLLYKVDINKIISNKIDVLKEETILNFKNNAEVLFENQTEDISEEDEIAYINTNVQMIDAAFYSLYYYLPAILILLLILLINLERIVYKRVKLSYHMLTYDIRHDRNKEKLKEIIKEKLNYKYRKISLPKNISYMFLFFGVITLFVNDNNVLIKRGFENISFILMAIITFYGLRLAIKFFNSKNFILKTFIVAINLFMAIIYPQIFFIIGLISSVFEIKVIIRREDKKLQK